MKRRITVLLALILVCSLLLPGTAAYASGSKKTDISEAKSAVVRVFSEYADGTCATGSAFGVGINGSEPQYFITNAHVCLDDEGNMAEKIYILLDNKAVHLQYDNYGNKMIDDVNYAKMVVCDVVNERTIDFYPDVAILKAAKPIPDHTCLPLHVSSRDIKDGSTVYALGFPGVSDVLNVNNRGGAAVSAEISEVNLTSGIISKKMNSDLLEGTDVIVHNAIISSGNSGGPLVDENGAAVGINTYTTDATAGQFVSIYIDYATDILKAEGIEFEDADKAESFFTTRNIILIAVVAVVAILAVILVTRIVNQTQREEAGELRIQGMTGVYAGRRFPIDRPQLTFGRAPDNNFIFPTDTPGVGAHHCVVVCSGDQLYIKDLTSSYGTAVNGGQKIPANQLVSLKVGDRFSLGSEEQTFMVTYRAGKLSVSR